MGLARALSWKLSSWPPAPGERAAVSLGHPAKKPTYAWGSGLTFPLPVPCVGHSRQRGPIWSWMSGHWGEGKSPGVRKGQ